MELKKIIHLDMDAFYASVEQRDRPELRNKPLAVGGDSNRGVIATASYEARKFGVHSAMPTKTAIRLCPQLIIVPPRIPHYKESSHQFRDILFEYTDLVEPLSLDEAYLDVTHNKKSMPSATLIAQEIRERVKEEIGLTCSAGISINKFLAKVASDMNKPDGLTLIGPEIAEEFIAKLPVRKFFGIGKVTSQKLVKMGILTGRDLKKRSERDLIRILGKSGRFYYNLLRGIDSRPVSPNRTIKSISVETTFESDLRQFSLILQEANKLTEQLFRRLKTNQKEGRTLTIKVKYSDFSQITRSKSSAKPVVSLPEIKDIASSLIQQLDLRDGIRLLGIGMSNFDIETSASGQLTLSF